MIVAGEASGDHHAAAVVREILVREPEWSFEGIGGPELEAAGMEILHRAEEISVVGISEVLSHLPAIFRAMSSVKRRLRTRPPTALLLVDFPDFNLHLAKDAKRLGVPVLYYISPQVWAWRAGRVKVIRERIRKMLVLFPFEERFYSEYGVPVSFTGHPLAGTAQEGPSRTACRSVLSLDPDDPVVALLPGSRLGEIERLLPPMLEAARRVLDVVPKARFVIPAAATLDPGAIEQGVAQSALSGHGADVVAGRYDEVLRAADAALVASGTATLDVALRGIPLVAVYRISRLTHIIAKRFVRTRFTSLVNLVAEREVIPELNQDEFTPENAARCLLEVLGEGESRTKMLEGLAEVRAKLGEAGAYRRAASEILAEIESIDEDE